MTGVAGMLGAYSSQAMLFASCKRELPGDDVLDEQIIADIDEMSNLLYNGIKLPDIWPPSNIPDNFDPMPVPYLNNPPEVIPIDIGRQLWVDDFLIKETTLEREFHLAVKYEGNPILNPETEWENWLRWPSAAPVSGGVYWDSTEQLFKMWYEACFIGSLAYATSRDGINWERPNLGVSDENLIFKDVKASSTSIMIDHHTRDPWQRFKLFLRRHGGGVRLATVRVSPNGINWSEPIETGGVGDRSTMFYNPFREKWVYSIRSTPSEELPQSFGRSRYYLERNNFLEDAKWEVHEPVFWTGADRLDPRDPVIGDRPQLYNLDAIAYESLMLGVFQIHRGPTNTVTEETGIPKITELSLAYSRDGFHWHRPDRRSFIEATRAKDDWERGYLQSAGGVCLIVGDELWFYYGGFKGNEEAVPDGRYQYGATGLAKMRRDGFASLNATSSDGTVTTRLLTFSGRYLFMNVDCPAGELRAEVLDEQGQVIAPFSLVNSAPVSANKTCIALTWEGVDDLSDIAGRQVSFRFHLKNGKFYAFWVSPDESGASHGYVAAGGPAFTGGIDTVGLNGMV